MHMHMHICMRQSKNRTADTDSHLHVANKRDAPVHACVPEVMLPVDRLSLHAWMMQKKYPAVQSSVLLTSSCKHASVFS